MLCLAQRCGCRLAASSELGVRAPGVGRGARAASCGRGLEPQCCGLGQDRGLLSVAGCRKALRGKADQDKVQIEQDKPQHHIPAMQQGPRAAGRGVLCPCPPAVPSSTGCTAAGCLPEELPCSPPCPRVHSTTGGGEKAAACHRLRVTFSHFLKIARSQFKYGLNLHNIIISHHF